MALDLSDRKIAVDVPHLAFATAIAGWIVWYCWDAWHANAAVENLILILPASVIAVVLYLFVVLGSIKRAKQPVKKAPSPVESASQKTAMKIAGSMVALAGFVIAAPFIGFDVASFAYILIMMVFLGERRIAVLLIFPLLFSVVVIYSFGTLLSTPLPVLILRGQY